jgi:flagellar basal body-associated protein FliL
LDYFCIGLKQVRGRQPGLLLANSAQCLVSVIMSKAVSQDNLVAYVAAAVVVSLVSIFVFTWSQTRSNSPPTREVSYSQFGPYQIETQNFSISASLAVETDRDDASWPNSNRQTLNIIFKKVLADTDVKTLKAANGLQLLQDALTKGCATELHTKNVKAVILTDFVVQTRDS